MLKGLSLNHSIQCPRGAVVVDKIPRGHWLSASHAVIIGVIAAVIIAIAYRRVRAPN